MPRPLPFRFNPRLARRFARLHRLVRKGLTPRNKAELRRLAAAASLLGKGAKLPPQ